MCLRVTSNNIAFLSNNPSLAVLFCLKVIVNYVFPRVLSYYCIPSRIRRALNLGNILVDTNIALHWIKQVCCLCRQRISLAYGGVTASETHFYLPTFCNVIIIMTARLRRINEGTLDTNEVWMNTIWMNAGIWMNVYQKYNFKEKHINIYY